MARRRGSARRHHRRRFGFLYKLLSVLAICVAIVAALTLFFKVDTIEVSGNERYTEQEVISGSGVGQGDNLLLLNKYAVVSRLQSELPYIESIRINKKLPSTLRIELTESSSVFAVRQEGTVWLVSPSGKIVDTGAAEGEYAVIDGCELLAPSVGTWIVLSAEREKQQESLLNLLQELENTGMAQEVRGIHLDSTTLLTMDYGDRFSVEMLYGADYARMLRYLNVVVDSLETNVTGVIDLTRDGEPHFRPN